MTALAPEAPLRPPARRPLLRRRTSIPGFGLTLGVTLAVLCLVVLIPLSAAALRAAQQTPPSSPPWPFPSAPPTPTG